LRLKLYCDWLSNLRLTGYFCFIHNEEPKLDEELAELESYVKSGNAYLPHLHGSRLRVLRFIKDESNPIPTYGRVLYKLVFEAVDLPLHYTKKMADEYLKLSADIAVMDDKSAFKRLFSSIFMLC
jgi:hypothetical protein